MSHWQKIRDAANEIRRESCASSNLNESGLSDSQDLLDRIIEHLDLFCIPEHPDSTHLRDALAVLEDDVIYFNNQLKGWYRTYCIAHEVGHFVLHHRSVHCSREDIEDYKTDEESASTAEKAVGYGAGERREREANLFALELLLPCGALRKAFLEEKLTADRIAEKVKMPVEVVAAQLARALLVPPAEKKKAVETAQSFDLDPSQLDAAETEKCPVLVTAGPGTGKTQTLTKRISYLLKKGIEPKRILALTFSNKAAEEMRERVEIENPEEAAQIQIMTFHAFGLDILRSYWQEAGLKTHSQLLDKIDALLYLEQNLAEIDLEHYQNLSEPTMNFSAILAAVSRAKDELCGPEEYRSLAEKMLTEAAEKNEEDSLLEAQKALETARVYEFYQNYLDSEQMLDFGDLIFRAVKLLRENAAVKAAVSSKYDAILVDEFQDVNRACGVLLKEVAGQGKGLWAVGDLRQSIYRWRGASPANIRLFDMDFPNARTISLESNYRSYEEIVTLFSHFAGKMKAAGADFFHRWDPTRGQAREQIAVHNVLADSIETEANEIAEKISSYQALGLLYKDQAVICRTHGQLNKFAKALTEKGIPVFYLGEIFEHENVRDLLSLLDLRYSVNGHSLVRVANFSEYQIPFADVKIIVDEIVAKEAAFEEILQNAEISERLSDKGRLGWEKLRDHLGSFQKNNSAWRFLADYLFIHSNYLRPLFEVEDAHSQSRRLAVYQFLRLAQNMEERFAHEADNQIPEFLRYVKKLAWFNEDKNYAQIPAAADNLDAVRLLTVHSAKGLEFRSVFLPYLGAGKIPSNRKGKICPDPKGMITGETNFHDEEEECLFFVAMSRARDFLHFSRASDYSKNQSKFLEALAEILPAPRLIEGATSPLTVTEADPSVELPVRTYYASQLDQFLRCPRQFFYASLCGLKGRGEISVYLKFHTCVYDTIYSLQSVRQLPGIELNEKEALDRLEELWQAAEIDAHPYASIYKRKAEMIVSRMYERIKNAEHEILRPTYEAKLSNGYIRVRPDETVEFEIEDQKQIVVRKYRTGKKPKKEDPSDSDAILLHAVKETFPDVEASMEKIYLSEDSVQEVSITEKVIKNRLEKYERAIDRINNREFPALANENNCPHCTYFFICPSGE